MWVASRGGGSPQVAREGLFEQVASEIGPRGKEASAFWEQRHMFILRSGNGTYKGPEQE